MNERNSQKETEHPADGELRNDVIASDGAEADTSPNIELDSPPAASRTPLTPPSDTDEGGWLDHVFDLEGRLTSAASEEQRVELLFQIAALWNNRLHDAESSAEALERILEIDPENEQAFAVVDELYRDMGRTANRIELLLNLAERQEQTSDRVHQLERAAQLYSEIGEHEKATLVEEAAASWASDRRTLVVHLKHLHTQIPPEEPQTEADTETEDSPDHSQESKAEEVEQSAGADVETQPTPEPVAFDPLALLKQRVAEADTDAEKVELYRQLSALVLREERVEEAITFLNDALKIDPDSASTYDELQRVYAKWRSIEAFAQLLEGRIETAPEDLRVVLFIRLGRVYEQALEDPDKALETYTRLCKDVPQEIQGPRLLADLAEKWELWDVVEKALLQLLGLPKPDQEQAVVLERLACVYDDKLAKPDTAEAYYADVLEIAPENQSVVSRLSKILRQQKRWSALAELLERTEPHLRGAHQRAALLFDAAQIRLEQLGDAEKATSLLDTALALHAEHRDALTLICTLHWDNENYSEFLSHAKHLSRLHSNKRDPLFFELTMRIATAAKAVGNNDEALQACKTCLKIDPDQRSTQLLYAEICHEMQQWKNSLKIHRTLLKNGDEFSSKLVLTLHRRLADAASHLGDRRSAIEAYTYLLERAPSDTETIEKLAELYQAEGNWKAVIETKERLTQLLEGTQLVAVWVAIGEIQWKEFNKLELAERTFRRALEVDPDDRGALHRLLDLLPKIERWEEMIRICDKLAQLEADAENKAKYYYAAAVIARDKLNDIARSLKLFNSTLDAHPEHVKAFSEIDRMCTDNADWKALEHNYGVMLNRLPDKGYEQLKGRLWQNLGEIMRTHRCDLPGAAAAFEAALALDSHDIELRLVLADIYRHLGPEYADKAIAAHHYLLQLQPGRVDLCQTLRALHIQKEQYDPAWCLSSVLTFLKRAGREEKDFYRQYRPRTFLRTRIQITNDLWRRLIIHPSQDPTLNAILTLVAAPLAEHTARAHSAFGLRQRDRVDPSDSSHRLVPLFKYVTRTLGVIDADLHFHPEEPIYMLMAHTTNAPSFVVGDHMLKIDSRRACAFVLGRHLTLLRPEQSVRYTLGTPAELETALKAVLTVVGRIPTPSRERKLNTIVSQLKKNLHRSQIDELAKLVGDRKSPSDFNLAQWWNGSELTADRMGLILANDLDVAGRMIGAEAGSGGVPPAERIKQLVQYICSPEYHELRKRLDITIERMAEASGQ